MFVVCYLFAYYFSCWNSHEVLLRMILVSSLSEPPFSLPSFCDSDHSVQGRSPVTRTQALGRSLDAVALPETYFCTGYLWLWFTKDTKLIPRPLDSHDIQTHAIFWEKAQFSPNSCPKGSKKGSKSTTVHFYWLLQEKPVSKRHLLLFWWLFALLLWSHILWRSFVWKVMPWILCRFW